MKTYAAAQVVLALAIAATVANAATIKVNPTTGSDTAGCGSVASPCKSIGFAYNQAVAGDLIHLHPSTYSSAEDKMISTAGLSPPKWDKSGLTLETDPTVIYGMGDRFDGNLTKADLRRDTPYNTYTRKGLPPTPIAIAGAAAIDAVVSPIEDGSLYFVSKGDGRHVFSTSYEDHRRAVRRYQLRTQRSRPTAQAEDE